MQNDFWGLVDRSEPDGCWPWMGRTTPAGYGFWNAGRGKGESAHRKAFKLAGGSIPFGGVVMHSCDNPPCCNPAHLRAGTYLDNLTDARNKGRWKPRTKSTHCHMGHAFTPDNTYTRSYRGYPFRYCRECRRLRKRAPRI